MDFATGSYYQKITRTKIHHILFWLVYGLFWMYLYSYNSTPLNAFINAAIFIFIHGLVSYFNMYVLFGNMLKKRLYVYYAISISLSVTLACFALALIFSRVPTIDAASKALIWHRDFFVTNAISISYTVAITMSLKLVKQWYEREQLTRNLEKLNVETELKYLKAQINPHFLFNCLNSLYALTLKKSDMAPEMVLRLSDLLRYLLYEAGEKFVDLSKEIDYVKNYLELEKIRHHDRLSTSVEIIGSTTGKKIAPMLFLTFLENSFKHGLADESAQGYIHILIDTRQDKILFSITNSKPSAGRKTADKPGGIGLENTRKRLALLYPNRHTIETHDTGNEYIVNLTLHPEKELKPEYNEMLNY